MNSAFIALLTLWTLTSSTTSYLSKKDKCPIPRICQWGCDYQRKTMYCTESMLGPYSPELPDLHDNNSWAADFSLNLIIVLQNKSFYVAYDEVIRVHSLNYSFNGIQTVEERAFTGLENDLHTLILDHNQLKVLPAGALLGLAKLRTLSLSYNLLTALDFTSHGGLAQLHYLDVSYNDIKELSSTAFHNIQFGRNGDSILKLQGNDLRYIDACTFQSRQFLSLKLTNNSLMCLCDMAWLPSYMTTQGNADDIPCVAPTSAGNNSWSTIVNFTDAHCKPLNLALIQCADEFGVRVTLDGTNSSDLILNLPANQSTGGADLQATLYAFVDGAPSQLGQYKFKDKNASHIMQLPEMAGRDLLVCVLLMGNSSKVEITHCQQVKLPVPEFNFSPVRSAAVLTTAYDCFTTLTLLAGILRS